MALTGTDRGTGNHASLVSTWNMSPTSNFTSGAFAVLCVVYDNSGASGADPFSSITDTKSNTWTSRVVNLYDPGSASAGVCMRIFTTTLNSSFTTSDYATFNLTNSAQSKAWSYHEVTTSGGAVVYSESGKNTGSSGSTPTVTTSTIPNGSMVIGSAGSEATNTWVGDADTTNGSWSTHQTDGANAGTGGVGHSSQRKIVTATATQTYNPTQTSSDQVLAWIRLDEEVTITAAPVVETRTTGEQSTDSGSHSISMPASIAIGDLILVAFTTDANPTITIDTGVSGSNWSTLGGDNSGTVVRGAIFYKIADGSDALTLNTSTNEQTTHVSLRISGASGVVEGTSVNSIATADSDPAGHVATYGAKDSLWVCTRHGDSTVVATAAPAGFSNLQTVAATNSTGASTNTAEKTYHTEAVDPEPFTSTSEQWVCWTVVVAPQDNTVELTINNASHAQTATSSSITQTHEVDPSDATHAQTASSVALVQTHPLEPVDTEHAQTATQVTLAQVHILDIVDVDHAQTATFVAVSQTQALEPIDSEHAQAAIQIALSQVQALEPSDASHAQTSSEVAITQTQSLEPSDAAHEQTASQVSLVQTHALSVDDSSHTQTASSPAIVQTHILSIDNADHAQTASSVTISTTLTLDPDHASHAQTADSVTLTQAHALSLANASHAQTASEVELSQAHALSPDDSEQAQTASSVTMSQAQALEPDDSTHAQTASAVSVSQVHYLEPDDALHAQTASEVTIGNELTLEPDDATHEQTASSSTLTQVHYLQPDNASHGHTASSPEISQLQILVIDSASHEQLASLVELLQAHGLDVDDADHAQTATSVTLQLIENLGFLLVDETYLQVSRGQGLDL